MYDLIIVGGGASGLMCAVQAASRGLRPLVTERLDRVGKKLLATGNGRCNLMNLGAPAFAHGGGFAAQVLARVPAARQQAIWEALGLRLTADGEGRVYPVTGQASTVLDALRFALEAAKVDIRTGCSVRSAVPMATGWRVDTDAGSFTAPCVVLAGGGKAQAKLGSDGSAAGIAAMLGLPMVPPRPGLCGLLTEKKPIAGLDGLRVRAGIRLCDGRGRDLYAERGEIIFAQDGVSGVCVMNASSFFAEGSVLHMDFTAAPGMPDAAALRAELARRKAAWADRPAEQLLGGLLLPRLASAVTKVAGIRWQGRTIASLTEAELNTLCARMTDFPLRVTGLRDFDRAQVTVGGVDTRCVSPETMEVRDRPGLYVLGELLDVDGLCGGFNLMFAFACGVLCAGAIAEGEGK